MSINKHVQQHLFDYNMLKPKVLFGRSTKNIKMASTIFSVIAVKLAFTVIFYRQLYSLSVCRDLTVKQIKAKVIAAAVTGCKRLTIVYHDLSILTKC